MIRLKAYEELYNLWNGINNLRDDIKGKKDEFI